MLATSNNQPNFRARVCNTTPLIKRVKRENPSLLPELKRQIRQLRQIGSNKTTTHSIGYAGEKADNPFCRKGFPFRISTGVSLFEAQKTSAITSTNFNLKVDQLAQKSQETLDMALSNADAQAKRKILTKSTPEKIALYMSEKRTQISANIAAIGGYLKGLSKI